MTKTFQELVPGTVLGDMYYGLDDIREKYPELKFYNHVRVRTIKALEMFQSLYNKREIANKMLTVVGYEYGCVICAYQYDGRYFGMVYVRRA